MLTSTLCRVNFLNQNIDILTPFSLPSTSSSSDKEDDKGHPETGYIFTDLYIDLHDPEIIVVSTSTLSLLCILPAQAT